MPSLTKINAGVLEISYVESGPKDGAPVFLMHGFPYDVHAYAEVAPLLAAAWTAIGRWWFQSRPTPRT